MGSVDLDGIWERFIFWSLANEVDLPSDVCLAWNTACLHLTCTRRDSCYFKLYKSTETQTEVTEITCHLGIKSEADAEETKPIAEQEEEEVGVKATAEQEYVIEMDCTAITPTPEQEYVIELAVPAADDADNSRTNNISESPVNNAVMNYDSSDGDNGEADDDSEAPLPMEFVSMAGGDEETEDSSTAQVSPSFPQTSTVPAAITSHSRLTPDPQVPSPLVSSVPAPMVPHADPCPDSPPVSAVPQYVSQAAALPPPVVVLKRLPAYFVPTPTPTPSPAAESSALECPAWPARFARNTAVFQAGAAVMERVRVTSVVEGVRETSLVERVRDSSLVETIRDTSLAESPGYRVAGTFRCRVCEKCFRKYSDLKRHVLTMHVNGQVHVCDTCGDQFKMFCYLKRHCKRLGHSLTQTSDYQRGKVAFERADSAEAQSVLNSTSITALPKPATPAKVKTPGKEGKVTGKRSLAELYAGESPAKVNGDNVPAHVIRSEHPARVDGEQNLPTEATRTVICRQEQTATGLRTVIILPPVSNAPPLSIVPGKVPITLAAAGDGSLAIPPVPRTDGKLPIPPVIRADGKLPIPPVIRADGKLPIPPVIRADGKLPIPPVLHADGKLPIPPVPCADGKLPIPPVLRAVGKLPLPPVPRADGKLPMALLPLGAKPLVTMATVDRSQFIVLKSIKTSSKRPVAGATTNEGLPPPVAKVPTADGKISVTKETTCDGNLPVTKAARITRKLPMSLRRTTLRQRQITPEPQTDGNPRISPVNGADGKLPVTPVPRADGKLPIPRLAIHRSPLKPRRGKSAVKSKTKLQAQRKKTLVDAAKKMVRKRGAAHLTNRSSPDSATRRRRRRHRELPEDTGDLVRLHDDSVPGGSAGYHRGERFQCGECGIVFGRSRYGDLKRHYISIHTDETPLSCEVCGEKFKLPYFLVMHAKNTGHKLTQTLSSVSEEPANNGADQGDSSTVVSGESSTAAQTLPATSLKLFSTTGSSTKQASSTSGRAEEESSTPAPEVGESSTSSRAGEDSGMPAPELGESSTSGRAEEDSSMPAPELGESSTSGRAGEESSMPAPEVGESSTSVPKVREISPAALMDSSMFDEGDISDSNSDLAELMSSILSDPPAGEDKASASSIVHLETSLMDSVSSAIQRASVHASSEPPGLSSTLKSATDKIENNPPYYLCDVCGQRFRTLKRSQLHMRNAHIPFTWTARGKKHHCPICPKKFSKEANFTHHLLLHKQNDEKPFACPQCPKRFDRKFLLARHLVVMHEKPGDRPFKCPSCSAKFARELPLKMHMMIHTQPPYKCPECDATYKTLDSLRPHFKKKHEGKWLHDRPLCSECGKTFSSKGHLRDHLILQHGTEEEKEALRSERRRLCPICGLSCAHAQSLHVHIRDIHSDVRYTCELCGKAFKTRGRLRNHARIHSADREQFRCTHCDRTFANLSTCKRHVAHEHEGVKNPYVCDICGYDTYAPGMLREHMVKHTGKMPYKCDTCGRGFRYRNTWKNHVMSMHTNIRPYVCKFCGKGFAQKPHLDNHERLHTGDKPYACQFCDYRCNVSANLTKHEKIHKKN